MLMSPPLREHVNIHACLAIDVAANPAGKQRTKQRTFQGSLKLFK